MHSFEVFIQRARPEEVDWQNFINAIFEYSGLSANDFYLEIDFTSEINFHIYSKKDISSLATKILPFILKPEKRDLKKATKTSKSIFFLTMPAGQSLLEIKEREGVKKGRTMTRAVWHMVNYVAVKASTIEVYFEDKDGNTYVAKRTFPDIPFHLLQKIDWTTAVKYKKKDIPVYLKLEKTSALFSREKEGAFLEVDGFPYITGKEYFGLGAYEFGKHTLVVGQTGVGKSKFIGLFVKEIAKRNLSNEYAVIVVDPHASLFADLSGVPKPINIDYRETACDLFFKNAEPKIGTELTIMLFKTLLKEQFNAKMEQVLKYSIFALITTGKMSLFDLKKFLTDQSFRNKVLEGVKSDNITYFFDTEFLEISTKYYDSAVMPILTLVDELNFLPVFGNNSSISLEKAVNENFLTCFSLSRIYLGDRATKLIAGLLIQQIFLMVQSKRIKKKIILIVDEVPVVENDSFVTILSEARKFNLSLLLSMQYLTQVSPELLKGILSNTYNYFIFKATEEDAKILEKNLLMEIPEEVVKSWESVGETKDDLKVKLITSLNVRECLVRVYQGGQFYSCFKTKTLDFV